MNTPSQRMLAEAWERGHFYCAAEQGDARCRNPYRKHCPTCGLAVWPEEQDAGGHECPPGFGGGA